MSREQYFTYIDDEKKIKNNKPCFNDIFQGRLGN